MTTAAERNMDAEARGAEAGHHAVVQPGGWIKVQSDTHGDLGKYYRIEFSVFPYADHRIRFTCTPAGPKAFKDDHLAGYAPSGIVPCMHAAVAARRLEREGLARLDSLGRWVASPQDVQNTVGGDETEAARIAANMKTLMPPRQPLDPFEGLPR